MNEVALGQYVPLSFNFSPIPGLASVPAAQSGVGGFIYKIICLANGKCYIGSTIQKPKNRMMQHIYELRKNRHHSSKMQNCFNKYGEQSFWFEIIEVVSSVESLFQREQYWINILDSYKSGLNGSPFAEFPLAGLPKTKEVIAKHSESMKIWAASDAGRAHFAKIGKENSRRTKGIKKSQEFCESVSRSLRAVWMRSDFREKKVAVFRSAKCREAAAASKHKNSIISKYPTLGVSGFIKLLRWCVKNGWSLGKMNQRFLFSESLIWNWVKKYCSDIDWKPKRSEGHKCLRKRKRGNCLFCGCDVVIRGTRWNGVFVCRKCYFKNRSERKHIQNKTGDHAIHLDKSCPHCKQSFKNNKRKFCSNKCKRDFHNGFRYKKPAPISGSGLETKALTT